MNKKKMLLLLPILTLLFSGCNSNNQQKEKDEEGSQPSEREDETKILSEITEVFTPKSVELNSQVNKDDFCAKVKYSDGTEAVVAVDEVNLNTASAGDQVVGTVKVGDLVASFIIKVFDPNEEGTKVLSEILQVFTPESVELNSQVNKNDFSAKVKYSDGTEAVVAVDEVNLNTASAGDQVVGTVKVGDLVASFTIKVLEPIIDDDLPETLKILYQGDSITDASRNWSNPVDLGNGYAKMISEDLDKEYGDKVDFTFVNNAHSGWNIIDNWNEGGVDHYQEQFYQFNADIVTILIGYNDIMDAYNTGKTEATNYVSDEAYEAAYENLLSGLKERGSYAICIGPYFIYDHVDIEYCQTEFANKRAIVKKLAEKYEFSYIDMKPAMEQARADGAEEMELFGDLTHPSYAGNRIIADIVREEIKSCFVPNYVKDTEAGKYNKIEGTNDNNSDLTNNKVYCYSSLGDVEYDSTVYYNSEDMASSESLRISNRGIYQVGTYTQAAIILPSAKNLKGMTLSFDVKTENAIPWVSLKAHSSVWDKNRNLSSEKGFNFPSSGVKSLGDGWYNVKVDCDDWIEEDPSKNESVLGAVRQLVFGMARGETESAIETYKIDISKPSYLWLDNVRIKTTEGGEDLPRGVEFYAGSGHTGSVSDFSLSNDFVVDIKFTSEPGTYLHLMLGDGWTNFFGLFKFSSATKTGDYSGITVQQLSDGYMRFIFDFDLLTIVNNVNGGSHDSISKINLVYMRPDYTTASGYIDVLPDMNAASVIRGTTFASGSNTVLTFDELSISDDSFVMDFMFTSAPGTTINFGLFENWDRSYSWFTVYTSATCTDKCVKIEALPDGYFRVTIKISEIPDSKKLGGDPQFINMVVINGANTTGAGYVELIN